MGETKPLTDIGEMTDRLMIDLYKKKIKETKADPNQLQGTWAEASDILKAHFGRITRIMESNKGRLRALFQTAIEELNGNQARTS